MKKLFLIPARGGSKGLPGKNILPLAGKPMIIYTIDAVLPMLEPGDEICVSTDDQKIVDIVEKQGIKVPFLRPEILSNDTASSQQVIEHALEWYTNQRVFFDVLVLLQPTSPLRTTNHIQEAFKKWSKDIDMIVSVKETDSNPYYVLFEEDRNFFLQKSKKGNFTRRQDCPMVYEFNGAIYIISIESLKNKSLNKFKKVKKYLMSKRSSIDIDDTIDFKLADLIIKEMKK